MSSLAPGTTRPRSPWQAPAFRWLILGRTVSSLGNALTPVALAFAVLDLGGSATELGLVVAAYALVEVVTTVFAGVLGDRFSRAVLMEGTSALAAGTQAVTAAALLSGWATIPLLTVLGGLLGLLTALAGPSSRAIVPQTVHAESLPTAVAALRLSQNTAMVLGFSAAGLLVAAFGTGGAIAVDAVTFALAAVCFASVRVPALPAPAPQSVLDDLRAGAAEVFAHTWLWVLIVQALLYHLVYGGAQGVLGPIVVRRGYGEEAWGWALGMLMLGFIVGGLLTLRYRPRRLLLSGTVFLALTACFPLAMGLQLPLTLILGGAFLHGFGLEVFSVAWDLAIQQNVAPDKLARVFAFDQVGSFVVRPLGLALTGPVAEAAGESRWLVVTAAVMLGSVLLSLLPRSVRRLERRSA